MQTLEAFFQFPSNALGLEIFRPSSPAVGESAAFCEDVNCVSSSLDRLSDDPLCSSPSIEWGGVYPVNAEVECCLYGFDCRLLVLGSSVDFSLRRRANGCGPNPNPRHSKVALPKASRFRIQLNLSLSSPHRHDSPQPSMTFSF